MLAVREIVYCFGSDERDAQRANFDTDLWEARLRLSVFIEYAAVGSWVQQGGVIVISGQAAGAL